MGDTRFPSGMIRSDDVNHLDYTSLPLVGLIGVARVAAEGAAKYGRLNYMLGCSCHDLLNHAIGHIVQFLLGNRTGSHLEHSAWNLLAAIQAHVLNPEISSPHLLGPGATLSADNLELLEANADKLSFARQAGDFDDASDWSITDLPEIETLLRDRTAIQYDNEDEDDEDDEEDDDYDENDEEEPDDDQDDDFDDEGNLTFQVDKKEGDEPATEKQALETVSEWSRVVNKTIKRYLRRQARYHAANLRLLRATGWDRIQEKYAPGKDDDEQEESREDIPAEEPTASKPITEEDSVWFDRILATLRREKHKRQQEEAIEALEALREKCTSGTYARGSGLSPLGDGPPRDPGVRAVEVR